MRTVTEVRWFLATASAALSAAAAATLPSSLTANSMTFFLRFTTYPTHSFGVPAPYTQRSKKEFTSPLPKLTVARQ